MFSKFTKKADAMKQKGGDGSEANKRGQMKFTDFVTKSEHLYGKCKYAPLVYSTKPGKTRQVQAYCPFPHDGCRKGLEFSEDVMLKCSVHGLHIPTSLITLSEKQDKTIQIYDADTCDVEKMSHKEKQDWMKDFESAHGRKPTNIYSYDTHNMLLPRCKECKTFKIGRSTTEASRGRYFFTCVGCGVKKKDFFCYLLNITKSDVTNLLSKVEADPSAYANIVKVDHILTFLKSMYTNSATPAELTIRLDDSQPIDMEDTGESVFDVSTVASTTPNDISENALLFIKSFFNFDNYTIITIKYLIIILESIKEKASSSTSDSVQENKKASNVIEEEIEDDVEEVPNKRIKL